MTTGKSEIENRREFDAVARRFQKDLFRYAFWLGRDRQLAEDVVQDSLLRAWKAWGSLRDREASKQWLVTIVRREHARQFERKRLETVELSECADLVFATDEDPQLEEMRKAIFKLETDYREPLVLQVMMGYTAREIAELMDLKTGAVLTRLHRARARIRVALGVEEKGAEGTNNDQ
ncbi:MAG: sigma-70 family RNA polymerase sigma factor [Gammaproteobacteria bacterium]